MLFLTRMFGVTGSDAERELGAETECIETIVQKILLVQASTAAQQQRRTSARAQFEVYDARARHGPRLAARLSRGIFATPGTAAHFHVVARLTLLPQSQLPQDGDETIYFDGTGNAIAEGAPLGSINRARRQFAIACGQARPDGLGGGPQAMRDHFRRGDSARFVNQASRPSKSSVSRNSDVALSNSPTGFTYRRPICQGLVVIGLKSNNRGIQCWLTSIEVAKRVNQQP
jgi:hypothetical protein